jgi:hypothetical protein
VAGCHMVRLDEGGFKDCGIAEQGGIDVSI